MSFWAAIPAIASLAGGLFGKKTKEGSTTNLNQVPLMPEGQQKLGDELSRYFMNMVQGFGNQNNPFTPGQAYTGQMSAGATPSENNSQAILQKFLQGGLTGGLYDQAAGQVSDTLSGKYANPAQSPYIQAITDLAGRNLNDQIDQSRAGAGARGNFFSTASGAQENKLRGDTLANLNAVIGDFANQERGRQFSAVPLAQQLDQYKNVNLPLSQIEAGSTFGSLNRTLEQADYERQYQDFLRQRGEKTDALGMAQGQYQSNTPYGIKDYSLTSPNIQSNNTLGSIMDIIGKLNFSSMGGSGSILSKLGGLFNFGGA